MWNVSEEGIAHPEHAQSAVLRMGNGVCRYAALAEQHAMAVVRLSTQAEKNGLKRNVSFVGCFVS
jgi:hypothetical protein